MLGGVMCWLGSVRFCGVSFRGGKVMCGRVMFGLCQVT